MPISSSLVAIRVSIAAERRRHFATAGPVRRRDAKRSRPSLIVQPDFQHPLSGRSRTTPHYVIALGICDRTRASTSGAARVHSRPACKRRLRDWWQTTKCRRRCDRLRARRCPSISQTPDRLLTSGAVEDEQLIAHVPISSRVSPSAKRLMTSRSRVASDWWARRAQRDAPSIRSTPRP